MTRDLTEREVEVLTLAAHGWSNDRIAQHFWLSVETVRTHLKRTYAVLDAEGRTHAVAIGISRGLITLDPPQKEH